jgi:hypothetical protein
MHAQHLWSRTCSMRAAATRRKHCRRSSRAAACSCRGACDLPPVPSCMRVQSMHARRQAAVLSVGAPATVDRPPPCAGGCEDSFCCSCCTLGALLVASSCLPGCNVETSVAWAVRRWPWCDPLLSWHCSFRDRRSSASTVWPERVFSHCIVARTSLRVQLVCVVATRADPPLQDDSAGPLGLCEHLPVSVDPMRGCRATLPHFWTPLQHQCSQQQPSTPGSIPASSGDSAPMFQCAYLILLTIWCLRPCEHPVLPILACEKVCHLAGASVSKCPLVPPWPPHGVRTP